MDRHEAFTAWLVAGARDALPRDIAVHASACPDCRRAAGAFDALSVVDAGAASSVPLIDFEPVRERGSLTRAARIVAGVTAAVLFSAAGAVAINGLPGGRAPVAIQSSSPAEGVLGNVFTPTAAPSSDGTPGSTSVAPSPSAAASETEGPTNGPSAAPSYVPGPLPQPPTPRPAPRTSSPRPSASPGGSAVTGSSASVSASTSATASPTPTPTLTPTASPAPTPTPTASPTPTPTPELPACSNGIDDDADLLTDYPLDPGCESATDPSEDDILP